MTHICGIEDVCPTIQPLGPNQTTWLAALRSNAYAQGIGRLHVEDKFCCLGVACEIFQDQLLDGIHLRGTTTLYDDSSSHAPPAIQEHLALRTSMGDALYGSSYPALTAMNDQRGYSFTEIADAITLNPEQYFRSAK